MTDVTPKKPPRRRSLLAVTISTLSVFLGLAFLALFLTGYVSEQRFAELSEAEQHRYLNHRLMAGLKTFEPAVLPRPQAVARLEVKGPQVLAGVPACQSAWDDAPGDLRQTWANWRGQALDARSTAERMAQRLTALDDYLARQSTQGDRRLAKPVGLDLNRWFESVNHALASPLQLGDPGRAQRVALSCRDIVSALRTLMPERCRQTLLLEDTPALNARLKAACGTLEAVYWRDTSVGQAKRQFTADQQLAIPANLLAQHNPWQGVRGCVYLTGPGEKSRHYYWSDRRQSNREVCEHPEVAGLDKADKTGLIPLQTAPDASEELAHPSWALPPSLGLILRPLEALRQPGSPLYRRYTEEAEAEGAAPERYRYGPNQVDIGGNRLDVGFSVDLTLNPVTQAYAQQVAACYTGNQAVCQKLGLSRQEDQDARGRAAGLGHKLLEGALVRMAGIAIIDIPTGRIEALAGALSPCAQQENNGPARDANCENRLPWSAQFRPDQLENPSLFHDAMPASTVKPIMAAAFLSDGRYGSDLLAQERAAMPQGRPAGGLRRELMSSNSRAFLDRMFCREQGLTNCERPRRVQDMASQFGWNADCANQPFCGQRDVLFGRTPEQRALDDSVNPLARMTMYGRLLAHPSGLQVGDVSQGYRLMDWLEPDRDTVRRCADGRDGQPLSEDDWAQCRAGRFGAWVHEGWGQGDARASVLGVAGMMSILGAAANGATEMPAPHLVEGVRGVGENRQTHRLQTAGERFGLSPPLSAPISAPAASVILDGLSWSHRGGTASTACAQLWGNRACQQIDWIAGKTGTPTFQFDGKTLAQIQRLAPNARRSALKPYKWYTAALKMPGAGPHWQKAIAVLTERNWQKGNGAVHGVGDTGPNPAAEIALFIAHCLRENPTGRENGACR